MKDSLPKKSHQVERAIVNLDSSKNKGTHWVCFKKFGKLVNYFDSFGNLHPPLELVNYFGKGVEIRYNYERKQKNNSVVCGHLCLKFLCDV